MALIPLIVSADSVAAVAILSRGFETGSRALFRITSSAVKKNPTVICTSVPGVHSVGATPVAVEMSPTTRSIMDNGAGFAIAIDVAWAGVFWDFVLLLRTVLDW